MEEETAFDGVANPTTVGTFWSLPRSGRPIGWDCRFLKVGYGSFPFYYNISLPLLLKDEGMSFSSIR